MQKKPSVFQSDCRSDRGIKKKKKGIWKERAALSVGVLAILQNMFSPDSYDERFTRWLYEDLPFIPEEWKLAVSKDKKEQFYNFEKAAEPPRISSLW